MSCIAARRSGKKTKERKERKEKTDHEQVSSKCRDRGVHESAQKTFPENPWQASMEEQPQVEEKYRVRITQIRCGMQLDDWRDRNNIWVGGRCIRCKGVWGSNKYPQATYSCSTMKPTTYDSFSVTRYYQRDKKSKIHGGLVRIWAGDVTSSYWVMGGDIELTCGW